MSNDYIPFRSKILEVIRHTDLEYTFRMEYSGNVKPGQFFEVSLPKYGEAPISVSGINDHSIDFTIRRVGKVTDEVFENYAGDSLFIRGPYGNGFDVDLYKGKELVVMAGGTGLSPVKGVVEYFSERPGECLGLTLIAGFKNPDSILFREDIARWRENLNIVLCVDSLGDASKDSEATTGHDEIAGDYRVGLVTQFIPEIPLKDVSRAEAIVVGPPPMMRFSTLGLLKKGLKEENMWVSQERKMCCGLGRCGHCRIGDKYVCLDGPVFRYTESKDMID